MSIKINLNKCVGCNKCINACPGNLLSINNHGKAYIEYPKDCWGCTACLKECKFNAIDYFLGEDIGGTGEILRVENEETLIKWTIIKEVVTNKNESNSY